MDVIDEDRDLTDFASRTRNGGGGEAVDNTTTPADDDTSQVSNSESDIEEDEEVDFATRLKHHRKELLDGKGRPKKKKEDFSQKLRKHRDGLLNSWETEEHHANGSSTKDDVHLSANPTNANGGDSDFGDFNGGATTASSSLPNDDYQSTKEEKEEEGGMIDFGDGADGPDSALSTMTENIIDDPFAGLSSAAPPTTTQPQPMEAGGLDLLGFESLGQPSEEEAVTSLENNVPLAGDNDFFGDLSEQQPDQSAPSAVSAMGDDNLLGAFESATTTEPETTESSTRPKNDDADGFGDFGGAPSEQETLAETPASELPQSSELQDNSETVHVEASDALESNETEVTSPQRNIVSDDEDNFVDFGVVTQTPQPDETGTTDEDDDFGDFGVAPPGPQMDETAEAADDEDFGDFGDAQSEPQPESSEIQNGGPENDTVDESDEFEDAQETLPQPTTTEEVPTGGMQPAEEDDDFGGFGGAPPSGSASHGEKMGENGDGEEFGVTAGNASTEPSPSAQTNYKDFGDFGAAPSTFPGTEGAKDDAGFGGFGEATNTQSATGTEQTEEQGFGDFGAAPSEPPVIETPENDDDFGDFGQGAEPVSGSPSVEKPEDEGFGGFGAAPSEPPVTESPDNDDDFGDFGEAAEPANGSPSVEKNEDNDFGDFGAAPSAPPATEALDNDDNFGDFGQAAEPVSGSPSVEQTEDDDFGDFGTAPSAPPVTETPDNDDDFGDFGKAAEPVGGSLSVEQTDDDDFGDFGAAPSAPPVTETPDNDDDFGDFGKAAEPVGGSLSVEQTDDDDFGDFGAAPSAPPVTDTPDKDNDDDDFGDFGEAAVKQPNGPSEIEQHQVSEDDDFGDFGDASSATATNQRPDDEFGDFGEASSMKPTESTSEAKHHQGSDDFGNFSDSIAAPVSLTPAAFPALDNGPLFQRAKLVFSKIYSQYDTEPGHDDNDSEEAAESVTLSSFMVSVDAKESEDEPSPLDLSRFRNPKKRDGSGSSLVIERDGSGGYAHFAWPIGGSVAPDDEMGQESSRRRSSVLASYVPDVLPIHLPTGKETAFDGASPAPVRPVVEAVKGLPKVPTEGDRNGSTNSAKAPKGKKARKAEGKKPRKASEGKSEAVNELLEKIPDLSFMLSPTLQLPKK